MLSRRFKLLYSMGDISMSGPLTIVSFFQLIFLTTVAGLPAAQAGLAIGIGRLWDAINDPLFSIISDKVSSRWGRRRAFLLFGALPLGLAFCLQFLVPAFGVTGKVVYYAVAFIVFDTVYTAVSVSYNALTPAITKDYDERGSLNGYRMAYSIFGGLLTIILAVGLATVIEDAQQRFAVLGIIIGLLSAIPIWIAFSVTKEYDDPKAPVNDLDALSSIRATLSNKPFWMVMGLYLFSWTTASLVATVLAFFAQFYMKMTELETNIVILIAQVFGILFIPFWVWMARKFDKRRAFIWGCLAWMGTQVLIALLPAGQINLFYLFAALSGSGVAVAYFLPWSMIPDVVELDELRTGQRREGSFYAFASFFQKLGTGGAIWLFSQALASQGFIESTGGAIVSQPASAVTAIRWSIGLVPLVLLAIAIVFGYFYPITREKHAEIKAQLGTADVDPRTIFVD